MKCQICGKESRLVEMEVGGEFMKLCSNCSRFGKSLPDKVSIPVEGLKPQEVQPVRDSKLVLDKKQELVPEYGLLIKKAREKKGMKQDELAEKLKEHASVLQKWERSEWEPDRVQIKKLEAVLGVQLMGEPVKNEQDRGESEALTLGDVVEVKE